MWSLMIDTSNFDAADAAWREGYEAGQLAAVGKIEFPRNPYEDGTSEKILWHLGFEIAMEDELLKEPAPRSDIGGHD